MNDDVQVILMLVMLFAFLGMVKGGRTNRRQRELQQTIAELKSTPVAPPVVSGPTQDQFEQLEQRLRVLERIVTDKSYDLASQIEALRDERPVAQRADAREVERNN